VPYPNLKKYLLQVTRLKQIEGVGARKCEEKPVRNSRSSLKLLVVELVLFHIIVIDFVKVQLETIRNTLFQRKLLSSHLLAISIIFDVLHKFNVS
jgi:hypothetical protein